MTHNKQANIFFVMLALFVASLIIFDLPHNVIYNNLFNILLLLVFILFFLIEKNFKLRINNFILMYFAFTLFSLSSIFWALDFDLAFGYSMRLIVASVNILLVYTIIAHYKVHNAILYGILIGSFYNYLIAFNLFPVNYEIYEFHRFTGSVGNSNKLSKVMLLSIFSSLVLLTFSNVKDYIKIYLRLSILLSLYVIFLTVSKKAIILAPILLLASVSFKKIKIKNILLSLFLSLIVIKLFITYTDYSYLNNIYDVFIKRFSGLMATISGQVGDSSSSERWMLIREGVMVFADKPLFGSGLNNFRVYFGTYAHNNYLELLVDVGIIGMVLYYSLYMLIIKNIKAMNSSILKRYLLIVVVIILIMDLATVTYFNKLVLLMILYVYYMAKNNQNLNSYE